jgi:hypothetical protein
MERQWTNTTYRRTVDVPFLTRHRRYADLQTHFTEKSYLKLSTYSAYHINHPAGTARGGTAIIIKTTIKHHLQSIYRQDFLQATSLSVEDSIGPLTISVVYLPPKFTVKQEHLEEFHNTLGQRFIAGGDYNANILYGVPDSSHTEVARYSKE